jgi:hypothetical protein
MEFPVYRLQEAEPDEGRLSELARGLSGLGSPELSERGNRMVAQVADLEVELERASGGMWAASPNAVRHPSDPVDLPDERSARSIADATQRGLGLLPDFATGDPFRLVQLPAGGTFAATRRNGKRTDRQLEIKIRHAVEVAGPDGDYHPTVGGGGNFAVSLGEEGRVVGYRGTWRPTVGEPEIVEGISQSEAEERFHALTRDIEVSDARSWLAYYSAPAFEAQQVLTPVYVFSGKLVTDERQVPMRLITIPATDLGPFPPKQQPQPERQPKKRARSASRRTGTRSTNPFEAGTSWIGMSGGLSGSQDNAQGFMDGLTADGWIPNFNWGDANAWESDWRRNDDTWVDAADFVFYTGHADMNGWVLSNPDDGSLTYTEVGAAPSSPGDLWGQQDLEWVTIAACGPLQDEILAKGGGDVLARWDGAFDGLHIMMGYGAITFDNTDEGRKLVQYAREGTPLIDAWLRTGQEIQPSTNGSNPPDGPDVWVGAMYVIKGSDDPGQDHLWGHGSVSADPRAPDTLVAVWTTT